MAVDIQFGIQVGLSSAAKLRENAEAAEAAGLYAMFLADHPGTSASPHVALAAAAAVTSRIHLGAYVLNSGVRHPIDVVNEINTLDVVSNGRAILGVGAGHTPLEWTARGLGQPSPGQRITNLESFVKATRILIAGGVISDDGPSFVVDHAQIVQPVALQKAVPLLVGGNGQRLLEFAGRHADIVSISGLGRTKADGHAHEPKWTYAEVSASIAAVHRGSLQGDRDASNGPKLEALVQGFKITHRREKFLEEFAKRADVPVSVLYDAPFLLVGTEEEIVEQLERDTERFGFTSYVVREDALADVTRIMSCLR
jgi:probable F420-dependent oxidoreductase